MSKKTPLKNLKNIFKTNVYALRELRNKQRRLIFLMIILSLLFGSAFFYSKYKNTSADTSWTHIKKSLSKVIELPDEDPRIIILLDMLRVQGKAFYKDAKLNDMLIVYPESKKVLLYRPSTKKIINFATTALNENKLALNSITKETTNLSDNKDRINNLSPTPTKPYSPTPTKGQSTSNETLQISIYNGTQTPSLTKIAEKEIRDKTSLNIEIVMRDNTKDDYTKNLIIDLNGKNEQVIDQLSQLLNADISKMPDEETKPEGDILIILGTEYVEST